MQDKDLGQASSTRDSFYAARSAFVSSQPDQTTLYPHKFLEVETPILSKLAGGAAAKPFTTTLDAMKMPLSMRIATELYLKLLVMGGLDRVYEIGRLFRNEGIDSTHNPEFTSCEFYWAYCDYVEGIERVEELISGMVFALFGKYEVEYHHDGKDQPPVVIDFSRPFKRVDYLEGIAQGGSFEMPADLGSEDARLFLLEQCRKVGVRVPEPATVGKLLDKLAGVYVEDKVVHPTFVMNHPQIISPLAKYHRSREGLTERFELFVNGFEVANAYTELNNPFVQRKMFQEQASEKEQGDDEIPPTDENYCEAMEYGMPPTFGAGIGIDRLTMLLTDHQTIKEVILFPLMKDKEDK